MKAKGSDNGDFQRPDPGTYLARCVRIVDIGTQYGEYQGKPNARRQIVMVWELPTELIETGDYAGQPSTVSKFYTLSLNEKATLRHDLENWRTKAFTADELAGFDMANVLGVPCMVTLTPTESGKIKVSGVTAPPKGTKVPKQITPSVMFSLEPDEFDAAIYAGLSEWFRETIAKTPEYQALTGHQHDEAGRPQDPDGAPKDFSDVDFGNDDIPF